MRTRSILSNSNSSARINVTPMIDVVMVLIVFYLLVGQLAIDRKAAVVLPSSQTGTQTTQKIDPIVIGITADGEVSINGVQSDPARFLGEISGMHERSPTTPIRVRAHRDAPFGQVRPFIHQLRTAGFQRVELVTEQQY